ncbi:MAG TPA: vWA domain-containing protein [Glycomyces sp.]|nr:vWA domain-containing protein [Glycomyces sp.]
MSSEQSDESSAPEARTVNGDEPRTPPRDPDPRRLLIPAFIAGSLSALLSCVGIFGDGLSGADLAPYRNLAVFLALGNIAALAATLVRPWKRFLVLSLSVALVLALVAFFLPQLRELVHPECDDPVELTVLLPVDGAFGFGEAVAAFNEQYTDDSGCKRANVTAYSAPWPDVQKALELGWEVDEELGADDERFGFAPQRDVGPRPDLWLAESAAQIDLAETLLSGAGDDGVLDADRAAPIGTTPLVVAVPDQVYETESPPGDGVLDEDLPDLVQRLGDHHGLSVVRSDPTLSYSALLSLEYLYGNGSDAVGVQIEKQLARAAEDIGLGLPGTDTDMLCKLTELSSSGPGTAFLTTERALSQHNRGDPLGEGCPLKRGSRSGYAPLYLEGVGGLDYRTARLHWEDLWAERRSEVAADLTDWLAGEHEAWSPELMGVRGNDYVGAELEGGLRFDLNHHAPVEPLGASAIGALLDSYSESRVPTNVLLAIDKSLSMGTQISGEGRNRFELAAEGVRAALQNLSPRDAAGLWTFPAEGGGAYDVLFAIEAGHGPQDADLLSDHPLVRGVDLHRTLMEGVEALEGAAGEDSVEAMVVLTDGADRDEADVEVADVLDRLDASEVSLYVIAVGDASCRAKNFADMTAHPRVDCIEAEEDQVATTFDSLFEQLWS